MKCQNLFSRKNKKKTISKYLLLNILPSTLMSLRFTTTEQQPDKVLFFFFFFFLFVFANKALGILRRCAG